MNTTTIVLKYGQLKAQVLVHYVDPFEIDSYELEGNDQLLSVFLNKLFETPNGYFIGPCSSKNIEHFLHTAQLAKFTFQGLRYEVLNRPTLTEGSEGEDGEVVIY